MESTEIVVIVIGINLVITIIVIFLRCARHCSRQSNGRPLGPSGPIVPNAVVVCRPSDGNNPQSISIIPIQQPWQNQYVNNLHATPIYDAPPNYFEVFGDQPRQPTAPLQNQPG